MIGLLLLVGALGVTFMVWVSWPPSTCKLHDWRFVEEGGLRCAKCQRRPFDD